MSLTELSLYYGLIGGLMSIIGVLLSGWIVDKAGASHPRAYALLPGGAFLLAIPFFVAGLLIPAWPLALAMLSVASLLASTFLAPALAYVQNSVPANRRSASSAMLLFCLNLAGLGGGPLFVGMVSDAATPAWGTDALVVGLLALVPFFLLTALVQLCAANAIARRAARSSKAAA